MPYKLKPQSIRLEAATACQLRCPSCPTTKGEVQKSLGTGYLEFKDFKQLVDRNPWIRHIELSNWGEIFLNPELLDIMKYAHGKNLSLTVANGANLNNVKEEVLEGMVKYRLRKLTCSIDGASDETYRRYRVGGNFDAVIGNIKRVNFFKEKYHVPYPEMIWQFVIFGHNEHELPRARKMAEALGMSFYAKLSWDERFSPVQDKDFVRKESGLGVASLSEYRDRYGSEYLQKSICSELWNMPQINFDGRVLGCCVNRWGDFGNAFKDGLLPTLNGEKMEYARQMLMGKREAREDIPCSTCGYYLRRHADKQWMRIPDILRGRTVKEIWKLVRKEQATTRLSKSR